MTHSVTASVPRGVIAVMLALAALTLSPAALSSEELNFGIAGNNQVFTSVKEASSGGVISLSVSGGVPSTVRVELVDIYADQSGTKQPLPLDSSPFSPVGLVDFPAEAIAYTPNESVQEIPIPFTFTDIEEVRRPILGGLKITVVPDAGFDQGLNLVSAIVATFAYYPEGYLASEGTSIEPELTIEAFTFQRTAGDVFPFNLIPDFPMLFNFGPIATTSTVQNTGNIFLDVTSQVEVKETNFFGGVPKDPIVKTAPQEGFTVPGQRVEFGADLTAPPGGNGASEGLPRIGVFEVVSTATGTLGRSLNVTATESRLLILFPWKYALVFLIVLIFIAIRIRRRRSRRVAQEVAPGIAQGSFPSS